jgi:hypothetical protein
MSQAELIKKGQIAEKKQNRMSHVIAGRSALAALINAAAYAQDKKIEDVNSSELTVHLDSFKEHQASIKQIDEEIKALEY